MYDVKNNFRNNYVNMDLKCRFCEMQTETIEHIYKCQVILNIMGPINCKYEDLFSEDINIVYKASLKTKELCDLRNLLLNP